MKTNIQKERRRQQRTAINRSLGCIIDIGSQLRAGLLIDISRSGLSFKYIHQGHTRITTGTFCELTLFDYDRKFVMEDISAMVVYDCNANEENNLLSENKIGVEFNVPPLTHQPDRFDTEKLPSKR